ncbi:efflux RND transporter permease subunit [Idiomarina abyssalis]|uniref:efflux RND transporter permease subunit n=1 Tax=Idiomarina abyssalis TaxID=86102 RepID=UPI00241F1182|nr:efflux RND transporter permease subunit [Idiomarina abyssalis]|tara:strand:+ start:569503 stop:572628 length:3126 start_codon:yes stop_codon:yes gene_type:complete
MIEAVIKHKHVTIVSILILCLLGITAALRIPVQMIPDLEVRTISVQTQWPGATPQDIEKEILIEQEEFLRTVPNLQRMESSASNGEASIELDFPFGVDVTETLILVNNALSQVPDYPENVDEPRIFSASFSSNAFMYFRVAPIENNPKNIDMVMMRDYIEDNVRPRMSSVAGVSQVNVSGGAQRQVRILMDKDALIQYNVSVNEVRSAISSRNRDTSAGELEQGKRRFLLRTVGRFESLEEIENTIIRRTGDSLVRLKDVADIDFNHFELNSESWFKGQQVLSLQVQRELGSNVIDIKYAMMDEVERINEELLRPAGMEITLNSDDVRYVESSVQNVLFNLLLGALFATLVMYGLMRSGRATLIAVIGIPICTLAGFLGLLLLDRTINVISLAGIAFAIGMTLDNTIVVLESIELERRKGLNPKEAAIEGVKRVWTAVLTSTLTTVMVFLPILFIVQEAGQLYSDIAIAISASIIASMFVAVTLVPLLAAYFPAEAKTKVTDKLTNRIDSASQKILASKNSKLTTVGVTFVAVVGIWWFLTPPAEYLPEGEEAKTFATMSAPPGYNLKTMSSIGDEIRAIFDPALMTEETEVTRSGVTIPALQTMSLSVAPSNIRIIAETRDKNRIDELMGVITEVYERYPGMRAFAAKGSIISSNDGGTRSINVDVGGRELNEVYAAARAIYNRSQEVFDNPRIQSTPNSLTLAQPLLEIRPDWERMSELGLDADSFGYAVSALTDGAFVGEYFQGDDKIDMYLYSEKGTEVTPEMLDDLPVLNVNGRPVSLNAISEVRQIVDTSTVRRVDSRRTVTLNIIPPESVALESGVEMVRTQVLQHLREQGVIAADISTQLSGAADQLAETQAALSENYVISIAIIYLLMVAIFAHWGYPLLIMATIPMGISAGIAGLALMNGVGQLLPIFGLQPLNQPFDMITMLGFLILMGTVINNPILVVERAIYLRDKENFPIKRAVQEGLLSRVRPITITTLTTLCGIAPLVFIPGAGTELYRGVGAIVMFGLIGAALVTIFTLPALSALVLNKRGAKT